MASPSPTNKSSAPAHQDAQPALRPGAPSERILTLARALGRIMATDQDRPEGGLKPLGQHAMGTP